MIEYQDHYCDVRTCFALADLNVPLGNHKLYMCGEHFELLTERRERGTLTERAAR